jgi:hypothetical protein
MADDGAAFLQVQESVRGLLEYHAEKLSSPQQLHYACNRYALLLIFQRQQLFVNESGPQVNLVQPVMP